MNKTEPAISVIIAAFNEQEHLGNCIRSVMSQDFKDIEIIVVDDASRDTTNDVMLKFASEDDRIYTVSNAENLGLGESRNVGIRVARGHYLYFLDADDSLMNHCLGHLYEIALKNGSDVIIGRMKSDVEGVSVDRNYVRKDIVNTTLTENPELLYNHSALNKLIRKNLLFEKEIFFVPPKYAEDIYFSLRSNYYADAISVSTRYTYSHRWGRQIANANHRKMEDARFNVLRSLEFIEQAGESELLMPMRRKVARNAFSIMARAVRVYDQTDIETFLEPWQAVLENMPNEVFDGIPEHMADYCRLVIDKRYVAAYEYACKIHQAGDKSQASKIVRLARRVRRQLFSGVRKT
jgi:glycosyltransferase involved in cell wall biosynthesis